MYWSTHGTVPAVSAMMISTQIKVHKYTLLRSGLSEELYNAGLLECNVRRIVYLMTSLQNSPNPRVYKEQNDWIIIKLWSRQGGDNYNSNIIFMLSIRKKSSGHLLLEGASVCVHSRVWLFATPWTVAHQTPLSMGFSRKEHWSRLPFSSPGDLPEPGIKPASPVSHALAGRSLWLCHQGRRYHMWICTLGPWTGDL